MAHTRAANNVRFRGVRPPPCSILALSLCISLAGAPVVRAAQEPEAQAQRIAVLPLKIEGQVDKDTRARWTAKLSEGLGRGQAGLVEPTTVLPFIEGNCERQSCYDKVRANSGATYLVRTTVVAKNRDFLLKLDLIDAKSGTVVLSEDETCEICGIEEVATLLDSKGALLQTRLASMGTGPAMLVLDTSPSGAVVYVDGEAVGTTPIERPVLEGSHRIRVSLNGYVAEERELSFVNGARQEVELELQRTPGNPKAKALGIAGLAGGVALLGAGVALVILDDREHKPSCTGANVDADMDCKFLYNTGPIGAAMIGIGAIVGTLGAVALYRNRGLKAAGKPSARLMPAGFGIRGQF